MSRRFVALFWTLLGAVVALPGLSDRPLQKYGVSGETGGKDGSSTWARAGAARAVLSLTFAVGLASVVVVFTIMKNPYYVLAENKAVTAENALKRGDLGMAMRHIDRAIVLAPDVGRYHVVRAKILDTVRKFTAEQTGRSLLAQGSYLANRQAVEANPFDIYSRLYFAESALTLAGLGQDGMGEGAIVQYSRLTSMMPGYWLSHFLLARAYDELGQPGTAIKAYDEAIRLEPRSELTYIQRGTAYFNLGQYEGAIEDYGVAIAFGKFFGNPTAYHLRGVALYQLGQIERAIEDFDKAIDGNPTLAVPYNNRGSAYFDLGQIERAIQDYDEAIRIQPDFAEAYANRGVAFALLNQSL